MLELQSDFDESISPDMIYEAMRKINRFQTIKGRQEDAEEFLGYLMDGLHEDFLKSRDLSVLEIGIDALK